MEWSTPSVEEQEGIVMNGGFHSWAHCGTCSMIKCDSCRDSATNPELEGSNPSN